jgi:hypothetical protein
MSFYRKSFGGTTILSHSFERHAFMSATAKVAHDKYNWDLARQREEMEQYLRSAHGIRFNATQRENFMAALSLPKSLLEIGIRSATSDWRGDVDEVFAVCAVMLGTNNAIGLVRTSMVMFLHGVKNGRVPAHFTNAPERGPQEAPETTLNRTLTELLDVHTSCREQYWRGWLQLRRIIIQNNTNRGAEVPPLPLLRIISAPMGIIPMLLNHSTFVMKNVLIPRMMHPDSFHLFGHMCIHEEKEYRKALVHEALLNDAIVNKRFFNQRIPTVYEKVAIVEELQKIVRSDGRPAALVLNGSQIVLEVVAPLEFSGMLREPTLQEIKMYGGLYCDCLHPSYAGQVELIHLIETQLAARINASMAEEGT